MLEPKGLSSLRRNPVPVGWALIAGSFRSVCIRLENIIQASLPDRIAIEDYRMYAGKEAMHTGRRLWTAELIGAVRALSAICEFTCPVTALQAQAKNRWRDKRLKLYYPHVFHPEYPKDHPLLASPHTLDAFKIGLAFLEKSGRWEPKPPAGT